MSSYTEFGKRCGLCHKLRPSRMFYRKVNGKWLKLCSECWADEDQKEKR